MPKLTNKQYEPIWDDEVKKPVRKKSIKKEIKEIEIKETTEEKVVIEVISEPVFENKKENTKVRVFSMKDILSKYIDDKLDFKLYYNNILLYDTKASNISRPILDKDYFFYMKINIIIKI
jgi:hypothetical protein